LIAGVEATMADQHEPQFKDCVIYEGDKAIKRLAELGLRASYFEQAVRRGHELRSRCTPLHPRTYPGQVMWAESVAILRTQLLDLNQGWGMARVNNYETSFHADRKMAIAIVGGDANTGVKGFDPPKAARRRGPVTERRVKRNLLGQASLLPDLDRDVDNDGLCMTWIYLACARDEILYSELSLPLLLGSDRKFSRWSERILMPELPLSGVVTPIEPPEDDDDQSGFQVKRKPQA
jgi:hypothetical protein